MPNRSTGETIKERAKLLLEALLAFVNGELTDLSGVEIEAYWQGKNADLFVKTELRHLVNLTNKYKYKSQKLTKEQIQEMEKQRQQTKEQRTKEMNRQKDKIKAVLTELAEFLQILDDKREKTQGSQEWKFVLKLWSTDKERNLEFLEQEWEKRKSKSSGEKETKSDATIQTQKYNIPGEEWLDNKVFVGRENELAQLHELLKNNQRVAVASVSGMGGVGKTELSRRYALANKSAYPGGICWLEVPAENVGIQILRFAQNNLGLILPEEEDLLGRLRYCWQNWSGGEALLIYNDVTDYKTQVKPFLPPDSRFRVLLTTRKSFGKAFRELPLDVLKPLAAMELLKSILGKERVLQEPWKARELLKWLGYLPLAIELVGRYLDEYWESLNIDNLALTKMLQRLQRKSLEHDAMSDNKLINYSHGVAEAIALSWDRLDENTQEIGLRLGLFALAPIGLSLDGIEDDEELEVWEIAIGDLLNLHLLKEVESGVYSLHPLVREFLQIKLREYPEVDELKRGFVVAIVEVAREIPYEITREQVHKFEVDIPHIMEVAENLTEYLSDDDLIVPFTKLGSFYQYQGFYPQAQPWLEKGREIAEKQLDKNNSDVATAYTYLALLYSSQGRYSEAEPLYQQAIEIDKISLPENHPELATHLNNLAELYKSQGRYSEAEPLYQKAIEIVKIALPENHPSLATQLNNLAGLYEYQGRYSEAEPLYQQAIEIDKIALPENHPSLAISLNNLANLYRSQGRYSEAEPLYQQAIEIVKIALPENHPYLAISLNNLGGLYEYQGRYSEAEPLYQQAIEIDKISLPENHPSLARDLNNLAALYKSQGRYSEAEPLYQQAIEIDKISLPENHPERAAHLGNLANLYESQGRYSEAEPLYQQAIEIHKISLPENHPELARYFNNLALLYYSQGRYEAAEPLYLQALAILFSQLGQEHPNSQTVLQNYLIFLQQVARENRQQELSDERSLQILSQIDNGKSPCL
ncbi:MAG: tetratricopeptide repeat protein [Microcoleaceae cyanobacterium MO_207.B10]|nr:tetratricopeptide repeat protein [Microcoleaceae cyanobacterium MO_207.B10]